MRITTARKVQDLGFWYKNLWADKKCKLKLKKVRIHQDLKAQGITAVDPVSTYLKPPVIKKPWVPPADPRYALPPLPKDHPDYHEEKAYTYAHDGNLWEGTKQAGIITNSVLKREFPHKIRVQDCEEKLDNMVQRIIYDCHLWDSTREKLPRSCRQKPDHIRKYSYRREFGVPDQRIQDNMLYSLLIKSSQILHNQSTRDHISNYSFSEKIKSVGVPLYVSTTCKYLITSGNAPSPIYGRGEWEDLNGIKLPDLFPQSPTIDLKQSHIYNIDDTPLIDSPYTLRAPHTLLLTFDRFMKMEQRHASALIWSYGLLHKYMTKSARQFEPASIQTIHTDGERFGYTALQMNTPDTENVKEIRNVAWFDDDLLFEKIRPDKETLRNTHYKSYNPNVIRKILAMIEYS